MPLPARTDDLFAAQDFLLDVARPILAEKDFLTNEKCRSPECAAGNGYLRTFQEPVFDLRFLRARKQSFGIEAGFFERGPHDRRFVHVLWFRPHVFEYFVDVAGKDAVEFGGDRAANFLMP